MALDAGGERELVQDSIKDWLAEHKTDAKAGFVYKAWLDAGGDKALIEDGIKEWLVEHKTAGDIQFLCAAWLDAGGERSVVWDALLIWFEKHRTEETAVYLTKRIARQSDLSATTVRDVLAWCRAFSTNDDVLWRLTQLRHNLFIAGVEEDVVSTSEAVLAHLIQPISSPESVTRGQIATLVSYLIDSSETLSGPLRERVDSLFVRWLRHPLSFGRDPKPHYNIQRTAYLRRLSVLIANGVLNLEDDREPLERFMRWCDEWDDKWKDRASTILDELKSKYPSPGLWDIVRFEE